MRPLLQSARIRTGSARSWSAHDRCLRDIAMVTLTDHERLRREMVERQIKARGVTSPTVLEAMGNVRREGYLPSYLGEFAYEDTPLPIEEEQTISQPYIV